MQLYRSESRYARRGKNLVRIGRSEYSDLLQRLGQVRSDCCNLFRNHAPLALREDEADGVRTRVHREPCILKIRVGTYLDPHLR